MIGRVGLLVCVLLAVMGILLPGIASASTCGRGENRTLGIDVVVPLVVMTRASSTAEHHRGSACPRSDLPSRASLAARAGVSETKGAVTNLGTRTAAENAELFAKVPPGKGMSGVFDHDTGKLVLRPSQDVRIGPLQEGSVRQYGGHVQVRADLGEALGENLVSAEPGRVSGFAITKNADGTVTYGWNSGQINPGSHGTRDVPPILRGEIDAAVRAALGL